MEGKVDRRRIERNLTKGLVLTKEEKLFLWRRKTKITQSAAAKILKISLFEYKLLEYGKLKKKVALPKVLMSGPELQDVCVIFRRRNNLTQRQVADKIGFCREWVKQMEQGIVPCYQLAEFWGRSNDK